MMSGGNSVDTLPRVLVISHNCFSKSQSNGRTLGSLFLKWSSNKIAQLFFYESTPDSEVCRNYYRMTDSDLIRTRLNFTDKLGDILEINTVEKMDALPRRNFYFKILKKLFYFLKRESVYFFILSRDLLWKTRVWDNKQFNSWMDNNNPEIILLYPGEYSFIYKIALLISNKHKLPIVIYNSENHYLKKRNFASPFYLLYKKIYNKTVEEVFKNAKYAIYSNDLLKRDFDEKFKLPSTCILTTSSIHFKEQTDSISSIKISYAGNLGHERWKSLLKLARKIKLIDNSLYIEVYSALLPQKAKRHFTIENGINYNGEISYAEVIEVINESDIVIHTEGFSSFTKWDISHGFSTKMADLLSSGKCFLMYGPKEIACVDYLIKNDAAWVATSEKELEEILPKIISSRTERERYLENARKLVDKRHNIEKNCAIFEELMIEVHRNHHNKK